MALSMDEQRMLDEMERKLADADPLLASRLTSFGHPGLAAVLRSPRIRILLALAAVVVIAGISMLVYALGPFRMNAERHVACARNRAARREQAAHARRRQPG